MNRCYTQRLDHVRQEWPHVSRSPWQPVTITWQPCDHHVTQSQLNWLQSTSRWIRSSKSTKKNAQRSFDEQLSLLLAFSRSLIDMIMTHMYDTCRMTHLNLRLISLLVAFTFLDSTRVVTCDTTSRDNSNYTCAIMLSVNFIRLQNISSNSNKIPYEIRYVIDSIT